MLPFLLFRYWICMTYIYVNLSDQNHWKLLVHHFVFIYSLDVVDQITKTRVRWQSTSCIDCHQPFFMCFYSLQKENKWTQISVVFHLQHDMKWNIGCIYSAAAPFVHDESKIIGTRIQKWKLLIGARVKSNTTKILF